jgi:hypothetical protein
MELTRAVFTINAVLAVIRKRLFLSICRHGFGSLA